MTAKMIMIVTMNSQVLARYLSVDQSISVVFNPRFLPSTLFQILIHIAINETVLFFEVFPRVGRSLN